MTEISAAWQGGGALKSEKGILELIDAYFPSLNGHLPFGRGDDCAELVMPSPLALSTDLFLEGRHFKRDYFLPEDVGAKALASAVSDLAAAGAVPLGFSLGLTLPPGLEKDPLQSIFKGMSMTAEACGIMLTGGDLSMGAELGFSVACWGGPVADGVPFLQRARAVPGDVVFLGGQAGLAGVGFRVLEEAGLGAAVNWPQACTAFLRPFPFLCQGQALARLAAQGHRISLMDLSDGLARDLPRLLGEYGVELNFSLESIPSEVGKYASTKGLSAFDLFMLGGEDYSLLGTCPPDLFAQVAEKADEVYGLGIVTASKSLTFQEKPVLLNGFDHFA